MDDHKKIAERLSALIDQKFPGHGGRKKAASAMGYLDPYLSTVLSGKRKPELATYQRFAEFLKVPIEEILGITPPPATPKFTRLARKPYRLPVIGSAAAGSAIDPKTEPDEWLDVPELYPEGSVVVKVKGTSMVEYLIGNGDYAIIRPADDEADVGQKVVVWKRDEGLTMKVLGTAKRLKIGRKLEDIEPGDRIIGVLVGVIRKC